MSDSFDVRGSAADRPCRGRPHSMSPFTGSVPRTQEWRHLRLTRKDGVATVTLARPEKLNALTFGAYADLRDLLAVLSRERSVRALVLGGEVRGFCSGGYVA